VRYSCVWRLLFLRLPTRSLCVRHLDFWRKMLVLLRRPNLGFSMSPLVKERSLGPLFSPSLRTLSPRSVTQFFPENTLSRYKLLHEISFSPCLTLFFLFFFVLERPSLLAWGLQVHVRKDPRSPPFLNANLLVLFSGFSSNVVFLISQFLAGF